MADISQAHLPDNNIYDIRDRVTHIELTQAQYDALVQADQIDPDKVYFITDSGISSVGLGDLSGVSIDTSTLTNSDILSYDLVNDVWSNVRYPTAENIAYSSTVSIKSAIDSKADTSSLSIVATSGSYNDLLNKPAIINYGTELPMSSTDSSKVSNKITALETIDYYQVPNAVPDNGTAQIPASVWAHRYILINVRRYGYFGSMLIRKQNIVEGQLGASCCIYVSSSPKFFKINETGLFTALTNFGTEGQWVDFIGIF